ncbi:MAG: cysteine--tRNA ligase [Proteobacteria bacterium]|nr:cysteine--tRNA ligase [Pseudomonadota bacterium]
MDLFNTLTKQEEAFTPINADNIGMYVCGPTVYDLAHLGNARPVVVFDVLFRLLRSQYKQVTYVRNITDVDDKINAAALASGEDIRTITTRTTKAYHEDMRALNALSPTHEPRATDHIEDMIGMIESLITQDFAYVKEGHVLFRVQKYQNYGHLSRRQQDELIAGARVEVAPYKEHAGDFVLWKPSSPELPGWDSPWGRGRPGWHIECSAMSKVFLGQTFDIHGGGVDLVFPHHENEIAQSCCAHQTERMANIWMHNGHLLVNGEKMSKSLGNFFTVRDVLKDYDGEVIRLAFSSTHYRQPLDWTDETPKIAKVTLDYFYRARLFRPKNPYEENRLAEFRKGKKELQIDPKNNNILENTLKKDLNTPLLISFMYELANDIFRRNFSSDEDPECALWHMADLLGFYGQFLGILMHDPKEWFQGKAADNQGIEDLIAARNEAKKARNFAEADRIRALLSEEGIVLEDGPGGTIWRKA